MAEHVIFIFITSLLVVSCIPMSLRTNRFHDLCDITEVNLTHCPSQSYSKDRPTGPRNLVVDHISMREPFCLLDISWNIANDSDVAHLDSFNILLKNNQEKFCYTVSNWKITDKNSLRGVKIFFDGFVAKADTRYSLRVCAVPMSIDNCEKRTIEVCKVDPKHWKPQMNATAYSKNGTLELIFELPKHNYYDVYFITLKKYLNDDRDDCGKPGGDYVKLEKYIVNSTEAKNYSHWKIQSDLIQYENIEEFEGRYCYHLTPFNNDQGELYRDSYIDVVFVDECSEISTWSPDYFNASIVEQREPGKILITFSAMSTNESLRYKLILMSIDGNASQTKIVEGDNYYTEVMIDSIKQGQYTVAISIYDPSINGTKCQFCRRSLSKTCTPECDCKKIFLPNKEFTIERSIVEILLWVFIPLGVIVAILAVVSMIYKCCPPGSIIYVFKSKPRVYIAYYTDCKEHVDVVKRFLRVLENFPLKVRCDLLSSPKQINEIKRQNWIDREIARAHFIIYVASEGGEGVLSTKGTKKILEPRHDPVNIHEYANRRDMFSLHNFDVPEIMNKCVVVKFEYTENLALGRLNLRPTFVLSSDLRQWKNFFSYIFSQHNMKPKLGPDLKGNNDLTELNTSIKKMKAVTEDPNWFSNRYVFTEEDPTQFSGSQGPLLDDQETSDSAV